MGNCGSSDGGGAAAKKQRPTAPKPAPKKEEPKRESPPAADATPDAAAAPAATAKAEAKPQAQAKPAAQAAAPKHTHNSPAKASAAKPPAAPATTAAAAKQDGDNSASNGKVKGPCRYHPTAFNPDDTSLGLPRDKEVWCFSLDLLPMPIILCHNAKCQVLCRQHHATHRRWTRSSSWKCSGYATTSSRLSGKGPIL